MAAFDQLQRASFSGFEFPVKSVRVMGGLRDHVHEYPHVAGGASEKLGRKLYDVTMQCAFLQGLVDARWANLWPDRLGRLRRLWEAGETAALHIPTIGTIQAYAVDWTQEMDARIRSGEMVEVKYREDESAAFLVNALVQVSPSAVAASAQKLELETRELSPVPSIFTGIQDAANAIFAFGDQFELAGNLVEAKILGLVALLREADEQLDILDEPVNHRILDALHELWLSAVQLQEDLQNKSAKLERYTLPATMAISDVARQLYGDTSRGGDILQLNAIEDPFAIPAGTVLRFYQIAA